MRLTDTQRVVLSAAVARADGSILPLPGTLKGGAAAKVCNALIAKGFVVEVTAAEGEPVWREPGDGPALKLVVSAAAREALGLVLEAPAESATAAAMTSLAGAPETVGPVAPKRTRAGTKQAQLIAMLSGTDGASIAEIVAAFAWQPHTVRGAIAGALKKRLGMTIGSEKVEGRGRVYRIVR